MGISAHIQAYVPASLSSQRWRFSSALGDAQAEITSAQRHAETIGLQTIAQQLLRSESMASSQIEGLLIPSNRSLAKVEIGKRHKETAQAALANIAAVKWAYAWALTSGEPFSEQAIKAIHERIGAADRWLATHAGRLRESQNWIESDSHTRAGAEFIPPPPRLVPSCCAGSSTERIFLPWRRLQSRRSSSRRFTRSPMATGGWSRADRREPESQRRLPRRGALISLVLAGRKDDYVDA